MSAVVVGAVAVASVASGSVLSKQPIASDQVAKPVAGLNPVKFTPFVPSNGMPLLQNASRDVPRASDDGCSPGRYTAEVIVCEYGDPDASVSYALFGDSHAAQWFPVAEYIASRDDARLLVVIKSSCPSIGITSYKDGQADQFCTDWRDNAVQRLVDEQVDHVFVANLHRQSNGQGGLVDASTWSNAAADTIDALQPAEVTVVADTPYFGDSPINCAIQNLEDLTPCAAQKDDVLDSQWVNQERAAVQAAGGSYVDMSSRFCTEVCAPYIGEMLVYRDAHHLTNTFTESMAEPLGDLLLPR